MVCRQCRQISIELTLCAQAMRKWISPSARVFFFLSHSFLDCGFVYHERHLHWEKKRDLLNINTQLVNTMLHVSIFCGSRFSLSNQKIARLFTSQIDSRMTCEISGNAYTPNNEVSLWIWREKNDKTNKRIDENNCGLLFVKWNNTFEIFV